MEFILGFLIACAGGLTGVGAGSITAPVLILFFHLKPAVAVGTALSFSAAIKFAVLPLYLKRKQVDYRILGMLCLGGIPGVLVGVHLLSQLDTKSHEGGIFLLLGSTIFIVSMGSLYRTIRNRLTAAHADHARWLPPIAAIIGGEVGFSSAGAGALGEDAEVFEQLEAAPHPRPVDLRDDRLDQHADGAHAQASGGVAHE